jgi:hypothetical protein
MVFEEVEHAARSVAGPQQGDVRAAEQVDGLSGDLRAADVDIDWPLVSHLG